MHHKTKDYIEENMNEICERDKITVEEVIYFVILHRLLLPVFNAF